MLKLNSAAAIEDDVRVQSEVPSIQCAVFDAIVQRQAHEVDVLDRSLLQIISKTGFPAMRVVEERAVAIDVSLDALVKNLRDSACVECGSELSAVRVPNAMDRPQDLFDPIENDAVTRFFAGMICRETAVVRRMPVLRGKNQLDALLQFIRKRDDFIAMRHGQRAARQKIILEIDND